MTNELLITFNIRHRLIAVMESLVIAEVEYVEYMGNVHVQLNQRFIIRNYDYVIMSVYATLLQFLAWL